MQPGKNLDIQFYIKIKRREISVQKTFLMEGQRKGRKEMVKLIIKKSDGTFCKNPEDICIRKNRKTERLFEILEKGKNRMLSENVEQN